MATAFHGARHWSRSLRFRLTLWYCGVLLLAALPTALLLYGEAAHALRAETDGFLTLEARRVLAAVRGQPGDALDTSDLAEAVGGTVPASAPAPPRRTFGSGLAVPVLLFDVTYLRVVSRQDGHTLAASPNINSRSSLPDTLDTPLRALQTSSTKAATGFFAFAGPTEEQQLRVLSVPGQAGGVPVWVQTAVPWDHNADALEQLGRLLALGLLLILAGGAAGSWLLVGRTLQPIQRIVVEAERLDADALPEALLPPPTETDSEIGRLVATLNRMTTRLHGAFAAQKSFAEAQQRFAADASHELRTPLTILRGEMELALARPRPQHAYQATLASALEEIDRLSRIVAALSFLARRDAGQMRDAPPQTSVDLAALSQSAASDFAGQARDKQITLTVPDPHTANAPSDDTLQQSFLVMGNADQLRQLLGNLLDNALKYTPPGGTVYVSVRRTQETVTVSVQDSGIGIAPEDLPHVFERFWRADQARASGGSGLGLAICAQIAQAHGGTVAVISDGAHGSEFCLRLPTWPAHAPQKGVG